MYRGGEGGRCLKTNKSKQGLGGSKLRNLEQTYILNVSLWIESKTNGRVIFITILLHFHYFIFLETANTQKSEVFLLKISLGNVNASLVTCWYPQIYNFGFRKEFLETLKVYLSRTLTTISTTPFVKNSPTSCVSPLWCLSE